MSSQRLKRDLNALETKTKEKGRLPPPPVRQPLVGGVGVGAYAATGSSSASGLSEPFTFIASETRTETITEGDCSLDVEVITKVTLQDGNGVVFDLPFE